MRTNLKRAEQRDLDISVVERSDAPGTWSVEIIDYDDEGSSYVTAFYGPHSEERARSYADWCERQ